MTCKTNPTRRLGCWFSDFGSTLHWCRVRGGWITMADVWGVPKLSLWKRQFSWSPVEYLLAVSVLWWSMFFFAMSSLPDGSKTQVQRSWNIRIYVQDNEWNTMERFFGIVTVKTYSLVDRVPVMPNIRSAIVNVVRWLPVSLREWSFELL